MSEIIQSHALFAEAITEMRDLVASTMGPFGSPVMLTRQNQPALIFRDGAQVIRSYMPADAIKGNAIGRLRDAAEATLKAAGDGTSTTTVLLATLYLSAMEQIAEYEKTGQSVVRRLVADRIVEILGQMEKYLVENAIQVMDADGNIDMGLLQKVATISANNDPAIGEIVANLVAQIGSDGSVQVEYSKSGELETEKIPGYVFPGGLYHPYFLQQGQRQEEWIDPYIVLVNDSLVAMNDLNAITTSFTEYSLKQTEGRGLVLVCSDLNGVALGTAISRQMKDGRLMPLICVRPPRGIDVNQFFEDLSALTGAKVFSKDKGSLLKDFKWQKDTGTCTRIMSSLQKTTIVYNQPEGPTNKPTLSGLLERLASEYKEATVEDQPTIRERINRLSGSVGIIRIPGLTQAAVVWSKEIVEDSYLAAQSALKYGVLPGCGKALLNAFNHVVDVDIIVHEENEAVIAAESVSASVEQLIRSIFANAGTKKHASDSIISLLGGADFGKTISVSPEFVFWSRRVADEIAVAPGQPVNSIAKLEEHCLVNAVEAGILDSAHGVISAVRHTASEIHLWITTKNWVKEDV
ncbi:MAG: hypothetical protein IT269_11340 [Saprospiraceae bacterium]|nr:hypothetical protein [Saprospiraceae bacterium]